MTEERRGGTPYTRQPYYRADPGQGGTRTEYIGSLRSIRKRSYYIPHRSKRSAMKYTPDLVYDPFNPWAQAWPTRGAGIVSQTQELENQYKTTIRTTTAAAESSTTSSEHSQDDSDDRVFSILHYFNRRTGEVPKEEPILEKSETGFFSESSPDSGNRPGPDPTQGSRNQYQGFIVPVSDPAVFGAGSGDKTADPEENHNVNGNKGKLPAYRFETGSELDTSEGLEHDPYEGLEQDSSKVLEQDPFKRLEQEPSWKLEQVPALSPETDDPVRTFETAQRIEDSIPRRSLSLK